MKLFSTFLPVLLMFTMDQSFDAEIAELDFSAPSALKTINGVGE
jgi:hypothetical protein